MDEKCCCCTRQTPRDEEEKKKLIQRLNRISGQVQGVARMVENDAYCVDILTQVSAIQAALSGFEGQVLGRHIRTCVTSDIQQGEMEKTEELISLLQKLVK